MFDVPKLRIANYNAHDDYFHTYYNPKQKCQYQQQGEHDFAWFLYCSKTDYGDKDDCHTNEHYGDNQYRDHHIHSTALRASCPGYSQRCLS